MATYRAIAATSETLRTLLEQACPRDEFPDARFELFQASDFQRQMDEGVSLFLYRVAVNTARRNMPPTIRADGRRLRPPLPVDLYYLCSAWAAPSRGSTRCSAGRCARSRTRRCCRRGCSTGPGRTRTRSARTRPWSWCATRCRCPTSTHCGRSCGLTCRCRSATSCARCRWSPRCRSPTRGRRCRRGSSSSGDDVPRRPVHDARPRIARRAARRALPRRAHRRAGARPDGGRVARRAARAPRARVRRAACTAGSTWRGWAPGRWRGRRVLARGAAADAGRRRGRRRGAAVPAVPVHGPRPPRAACGL